MANKIQDNPLIIEFLKPVEFEGEKVKKIDLTGLEKVTTTDLMEVEKQYTIAGNFSAQPETSVAYARIMAARVSKKPLEFFDKLKGKQMMKIKNAVGTFFYEPE